MTLKDQMTLEDQVAQNTHSIAEIRELLYELISYSVDQFRRYETRQQEYEARRQQEEERRQQEEERRRQEEERRRQEEERRRQEEERSIAQLRKEMGYLSRKLGSIVEDFVEPDLARILRQLANLDEETPVAVNIRVKQLHPQGASNGRRTMLEIDAIAESREVVLVNETKSTLRSEDVTNFLEVLAVVREFFPEYEGRTIIGCVSSFRVEKDVLTYASRQGLVVLALNEGLMTVLNEPGFQWRTF